jgi:Flp pilus assembly protein TadG
MRQWSSRTLARDPAAGSSGVSGRAGIGRQRGQALVEFALTVSVMAMLLVGVADFARAFYFDVVVSGAANEGARVSAGGGSDDTVSAAARASAPSGVICSSCVTVTPSQAARADPTATGACSPSTCVWTTVTVTYSFAPFTPLVAGLVGNQVTLTRSVTQRMRAPCALPPSGNPPNSNPCT